MIGPNDEIENADPDEDDYEDSPDDHETPPPSSYEEFWADPCWSEPF